MTKDYIDYVPAKLSLDIKPQGTLIVGEKIIIENTGTTDGVFIVKDIKPLDEYTNRIYLKPIKD